MTVLTEQQVTIAEDHATAKILGHVKHSYLNNMDSLASSIGPEVKHATSKVYVAALFVFLSCLSLSFSNHRG